MYSLITTLLSAGLLLPTELYAAPVSSTASNALRNPFFGPIPGRSTYYSDYNGTDVAFPGNYTGLLPAISQGPPGKDDLLFQNLLQAEWVIFSFYQAGVENFNTSAFVEAGFPEDTYLRIVQIRDNEAGHARIFQEQISNTSVVPGRCQYLFGDIVINPTEYLAASTILEISSMAFLTGLVLQAQLPSSKSALLAIAETESRHNTWGLIDIWHQSPFAGPADTVYPYANQILTTTNVFVAPGSCPQGQPLFPNPDQNLPPLSAVKNSTTYLPGSPITFAFTSPKNQPTFVSGKQYYAVYYHGLGSVSVPFDPATNKSVIPADFESNGLILAVIAKESGAPTMDSVIAGPFFDFQQPIGINAL